MFTHTELGDAVRAVGRGGEPFTSAAVRAHLGMTTEERRALTRFNDALRAYCKLRSDCLVQLGKNRYCLLESDEPEAEDDRPRRPLHLTIRITRPLTAEEPKPALSWLWALVARFLRPALRLAREQR
jgi:hypothetical protein